MSRWHKESCTKPQVVVEGGTPRCKACDSECRWQLEADLHKFKSAPISIPEDEPPGQMGLWWPPHVKYTDQSAELLSKLNAPDGPLAAESSQPKAPSTHKEPMQSAAPRSPIYTHSLPQKAFVWSVSTLRATTTADLQFTLSWKNTPRTTARSMRQYHTRGVARTTTPRPAVPSLSAPTGT
ncbi:hypothetical protein QBC35DRAFT_57555 [Podospora australis]|uniref:Uncharacterized protein n=1 Tax=Podospora australis TaxID=1536484 RepID=A0AAN6X047_9PEZI|nr:hypothetical protein QBC35DRAFT_57555 [Podospora australis]